jgi:hypothetical protein
VRGLGLGQVGVHGSERGTSITETMPTVELRSAASRTAATSASSVAAERTTGTMMD